MRALLPVAMLLLAGCVGAPIGDPGTDIATPTGPCEVDGQPTPEPSAEVAPVDYPEAPSTLSTQSVQSYVTEFENSYRHNHALAEHGNVTYLETYVEDTSATKHGDSYVVHLSSYTNGGTMESEGEGTPIQIHWDGAPEPVTYLVTDDRVLRGEGDRSPAELRNASTVACR